MTAMLIECRHCDVERMVKQADKAGKLTTCDAQNCSNVIERIAINSYRTAKYIMADMPEDPKSDQRFSPILPSGECFRPASNYLR